MHYSDTCTFFAFVNDVMKNKSCNLPSDVEQDVKFGSFVISHNCTEQKEVGGCFCLYFSYLMLLQMIKCL